jgi:hypothetical protein
MRSVIKGLIGNGQVSLFADYRRGDATDFSGLSRTGVVTDPVTFDRNGAHFSGVGRIVHPDHVSGRNTTGSVVILGQFIPQTRYVSTRYIFAYSGGVQRFLLIQSSASALGVNCAVGGIRTATVDVSNKKYLGINYAS